MPFDGVIYRDTRLAYPAQHHSRAALQGKALSIPLRTAYFYARNHDRRVFQQHYAMTFRDPSSARDRMFVTATGFTRIGEGHRYIPDSVTHLVAESVYSIMQAGSQINVRHRLAVTDGSTTDTGGGVTTPVASAEGDVPVVGVGSSLNELLLRFVAAGKYAPYGPRPNTYTTRFEVALSGVTAGAVREVYATAYAVDDRTNVAVSMFPQFVSCWWEVRG